MQAFYALANGKASGISSLSLAVGECRRIWTIWSGWSNFEGVSYLLWKEH